MDKDKIFKYFFVFLLGLTLYLAFLILRPYFTYIILGMILTYAFGPLYRRVRKRIKHDNLAATLVVIFIILVIIIPTFFIIFTLVKQTSQAFQSLGQSNLTDAISDFLYRATGTTFDVQGMIAQGLGSIKSYLISISISAIGVVSEAFIGLFITFFIIFYGLKSGDDLIAEIKSLIPLHDRYKNKFFEETKNLTHAVIYGQLITSLIQGAIGGIGFWIFGIPNPVFWGVIMVILAFLPVVGTPMVWVPAVIWQLMSHNYVSGIGLLVYSAILTTNVDNFLRPTLISSRTKLHPVLVLLGVFGGLAVFGFIGVIIGPIVLAILIIFLQEYTVDFKSTLIQKEDIVDPKLEEMARHELEKEDHEDEKSGKDDGRNERKEESKDKNA